MSFVLHIWEATQPIANIDEAGDQAFSGPQQCEQNPKFIAFAKQLTEKYPDADPHPEDDDAYFEEVWSDSPLDGVCNELVYTLGIFSDCVDMVKPFVVTTANALGLTVYDMQEGEAFLPDGRVFS